MHPIPPSRRTPPASAFLAVALAVPLVIGCHSRPESAPGSTLPAGQAASVDASWVTAAESCWPAIRQSGRSLKNIREYLLAPDHLRSTFPSYAGLSNDQIAGNLTLPIASILPPDTSRLAHSQTPVLTRGQAAAGTGPDRAVVSATNGIAPPDSLCSIQSGTPDGF